MQEIRIPSLSITQTLLADVCFYQFTFLPEEADMSSIYW